MGFDRAKEKVVVGKSKRKPGAKAKGKGVNRAADSELQGEATIEEFQREGMGVAPKE
jgi:hypothetical protein